MPFLTAQKVFLPRRFHGFRQLINVYGTEYSKILEYIEAESDLGKPIKKDSSIVKAEVIHGIREERAQKLSDIVFRRTGLGTAGYPGDACLEICASIMAKELNWSAVRTESEIEDVRLIYSRQGIKTCQPIAK